MTTSDIINIVTASASGVAVIVSIVALWLGGRANRRANEIQEQLLNIEQSRENEKARQGRRAVLVIGFKGDTISSGYSGRTLTLENRGEGEARNVTVTIDDQPIQGYARILTGPKEEQMTVGPHCSCIWTLLSTLGTADPSEAVVNWQDDSGEPGYLKTTL